MGDGGIFGGFDPGSFFGGVIATLVQAINAIIAALQFLWQLLVLVFQFLYNALVAIVNALIKVVQIVVRGFIHFFTTILPNFLKRLYQDYIDLKAKITAWLQPVLRILLRIRQLFQQYVLAPLLRTINLIQHLRQFLVIFRLLGFKWAARLDNYLSKLEQQLVQNVLVIQAWINLAISVLDLIIDPSMILRKNFLLASLLSFLGAVKRVFFFGANRTPSTDEKAQAHQDSGSLSKGSNLLVSGFGSGATYSPTVERILPCLDSAIAYYSAKPANG
jgi:hypothetical protein